MTRRFVQRLSDRLALWQRLRDVRRDAGVVIYGDPRNLYIAAGVILQAHVVIHAGGMAWCGDAGKVEIGQGSVISPGCVIYGAGTGGVHIGRNFDCGPMVGIFASRTSRSSGGHVFAPVIIGDDVTVFAGAVISPGVTIGDRAVVAAGAVVTRDVLPDMFVGGLPARPIGRTDPEAVTSRHGGVGPSGEPNLVDAD